MNPHESLSCRTRSQRWLRATLAAAATLALSLPAGACRDEAPPPPASAEKPARTVAKGAPAEPDRHPTAGEPSSPAAGAPRALRRPERPIAVGGCRERCRTPEAAARGFATALTADDADALIPFVETSRLVHDGAPLGRGWAAQWRARKLDERSESIRQWAGRTVAGRLRNDVESDVPPQVVMGAADGDDEARAEIRFGPDGPVWRVRLARRGLEWLVSGVETGD